MVATTSVYLLISAYEIRVKVTNDETHSPITVSVCFQNEITAIVSLVKMVASVLTRSTAMSVGVPRITRASTARKVSFGLKTEVKT